MNQCFGVCICSCFSSAWACWELPGFSFKRYKTMARSNRCRAIVRGMNSVAFQLSIPSRSAYPSRSGRACPLSATLRPCMGHGRYDRRADRPGLAYLYRPSSFAFVMTSFSVLSSLAAMAESDVSSFHSSTSSAESSSSQHVSELPGVSFMVFSFSELRVISA